MKAIALMFVGPAAADSCIDYMNQLRAQHGHPALNFDASKAGCAANDASYDGQHGRMHASFGQCGEWAQCEAGNLDADGCHKSVDQFYGEGPGGGHYQIMMETNFVSVAHGSCQRCFNDKGTQWNLFTFNFYLAPTNATGQSPLVEISNSTEIVV